MWIFPGFFSRVVSCTRHLLAVSGQQQLQRRHVSLPERLVSFPSLHRLNSDRLQSGAYLLRRQTQQGGVTFRQLLITQTDKRIRTTTEWMMIWGCVQAPADLHVLLARLVVVVGVRRVPQLDLLLLQLVLQLRLRVLLLHHLRRTRTTEPQSQTRGDHFLYLQSLCSWTLLWWLSLKSYIFISCLDLFLCTIL